MAANNRYSRTADKDHASVVAEKLRVSFEYLDLASPHFFIHGLEAEHYRKVFDCLNELAATTEDQIVQQTHPSLTPKSIFNKDKGTHNRFPEWVEEKIAQKVAGSQRAVKSSGLPVPSDEEARELGRAQAKTMISRAFEVRIAKSYGRIHGMVWDKTFYVVWFDPAHNLYPSTTSGIRLHDNYAAVTSFGPEGLEALREANSQLTDTNEQLQKDLHTLRTEHAEWLDLYAQR